MNNLKNTLRLKEREIKAEMIGIIVAIAIVITTATIIALTFDDINSFMAN